jgi:hypothetical protein
VLDPGLTTQVEQQVQLRADSLTNVPLHELRSLGEGIRCFGTLRINENEVGAALGSLIRAKLDESGAPEHVSSSPVR